MPGNVPFAAANMVTSGAGCPTSPYHTLVYKYYENFNKSDIYVDFPFLREFRLYGRKAFIRLKKIIIHYNSAASPRITIIKPSLPGPFSGFDYIFTEKALTANDTSIWELDYPLLVYDDSDDDAKCSWHGFTGQQETPEIKFNISGYDTSDDILIVVLLEWWPIQ